MDLSEIFRQYGTDKDINGYSQLYHILFDHLKDKPLKLLEIGIGTMIVGAPSSMVGYSQPGYKPGGSLRAWRDYFKNGEIYGFDVQPDTQFTEDRIQTRLCDSTQSGDVKRVIEELGDIKFDIIIDDGNHYDQAQLMTLMNFYSYLKDGGIYIIEDIYPGSTLSVNPKIIGQLCNNDPYILVGVKNNMCVIYKKHLNCERVNNF